jgi:hypothetical protein
MKSKGPQKAKDYSPRGLKLQRRKKKKQSRVIDSLTKDDATKRINIRSAGVAFGD